MNVCRTLWIPVILLINAERVSSFASFPERSTRFSATVSWHLEASTTEETGSDQRTLYDVLQTQKDATYDELKQQYRKLAKQTHPDSQIGTGIDTTDQFVEIADAWKILSDKKERKRYDRFLRAEEIKATVEEAATKGIQQAAPQVKKVVDAAFPFLRRTTVTTVATVSAAADGLSNKGKNIDLAGAVVSAIRAGRAAGRIVDGMELLDKAFELDKRAEADMQQIMLLQAELSDVMDKRLNLALRIPNSGLSSFEALRILDGLNTPDLVTLGDRLALRHTLQFEISELEGAELEYYEKTSVAAKHAADAEEYAKEALREAQKKVATGTFETNLTQVFNTLDGEEKRIQNELQKATQALQRRQERVRQLLLRKEKMISEQRAATSGGTNTNLPEDFENASLEDLGQLQQREQFLMEEIERIENIVKRMVSRSNNLKERAEEAQNVQRQGGERQSGP